MNTRENKNEFVKMLRTCILLLVVIVFISNSVFAQTSHPNFKLIQSKSGISLGKINAITQDHYGFLWFSDQTNRCILRYDGSQMTRYPYEPDKPNTLGGFYPECLAWDPSGSGALWIGFFGQGVDRFDPVSNTFTHYQHDSTDENSLMNDVIGAIHVDQEGHVWIGTDKGVDRLDPKTGIFTHFQYNENDPNSLSHDVVRTIYEDKEGSIWVGCGLPWFPNEINDKGGLNRFNKATNNFTRFLHDPTDPNSLKDNKIRAIFEDSKGNFWVGTRGNGVHIMDRQNGTFTRIPYGPANSNQLTIPTPESHFAHITFIKEGLDENIWIGTYENGTVRYDPDDNSVVNYGTDGILSGDLKENSTWWGHVASDGIIWLTTQQSNTYMIDPHYQTIPEVYYEGFNLNLLESDNNELWIGTWTRGLIKRDLKTGKEQQFLNLPNDPSSLSDNRVHTLYFDSEENLWVGTDIGLNLYDPLSESFTRYFHQLEDSTSLSHSEIYAIYEDQRKNLWIGTFNGLNMLDQSTGKFTRFLHDPDDINSLSDPRIQHIVQDKYNNIWVGTLDGLNRLDLSTGKFERHLSDLQIGDIHIDQEDVIWIGTPAGLYKSNENLTGFTPFRAPESGMVVGEIVRSITGDLDDHLWLGTSAGIIMVDKERENRTVYGLESGVDAGDFGSLSRAYMGKDGSIYFISDASYYTFHPKDFQKKPGEPTLYISNFWVSNELVSHLKDGPIQGSLYDIEEVNLNYNENVFGLSFTTVDFRRNLEEKIFYKLEEYDEEWLETLPGQRITYNRISPGDYILQYKTRASNGEEIEKSLSISVAKPWWKTWWAYVGYILLASLSGWRVHLFQKERTIKKERERTQKRELEQARKIEKAYKELGEAHESLKATQAQLIQSEKMASLGELTAGIAHEIKNPLNFVNNFSDVNAELADELLEEIENEDYEEVKAIAKDIKSNQEKIVHHGRRADSIVKNMLQHSRTGSGEKQMTDINALADEYLRLAYHGLRAKDSNFNSKMETHLDDQIIKVNVVPQDIGRVLLNLFTNAFQACAERQKLSRMEKNEHDSDEGREVKLENYIPLVVLTTESSNGQILIKVSDNGNGIPEDIKNKIFQPFFTTKPTGQGTGLGLSMSYDIIKAHGGDLIVNTKVGEGTEFVVKLQVGVVDKG